MDVMVCFGQSVLRGFGLGASAAVLFVGIFREL